MAIVFGFLGFVLALATPLLPVNQSTATLSWPQAGRVQSVLAPLVSYVPTHFEATVPCSAVDQLDDDDHTVLVSTTPKDAPKATARGLFIRRSGTAGAPDNQQTIEVLVRNSLVVATTLADVRAQNCQRIEVTADSDKVSARFVGMTEPDGSPLEGETSDGDQRPQVTGIYSDLAGPSAAIPGLSATATIDTRYTTSPTPLKRTLIIIGILATIASLIALARLDATDGHGHRRIFPHRWWRLNIRDVVVIGALIVWHFIGINTSDDGYLLTMSRVAEHAHYTANYYRWYGAPEAPFGWYYQVFGWLAQVTTASPWVRLPALACGIMVWLIISHEVLPRLGRAAKSNATVGWTAAFVFLACWFPFNNGLRPEPIICLGALLTWCSVERAIATGRLLPAAIACLIGAFSLAAGPTGLMAVAALIAGARPIMGSYIKRAKEIRGTERFGNLWWSMAALMLPILAAGVFVIFVVFSSLTLTAFVDSSQMKTALGPSSHWYNEIARYSALFEFSANGSVGRRFAVLSMFAGLVVSAAMLIRKNRIPGTAVGPSRRIVGITFMSLIFLMFTPTKWTHHFGVFAGLAPALAAIAAIAVTGEAMNGKRNRLLFTSLVLFITGLSFTGPNASFYYSNWGMPWGVQMPHLVVDLGNALLYLSLIALACAAWVHFREPYTQPAASQAGAGDTAGTSGSWRAVRSSPLMVLAFLVVVFEVATAVVAGTNQSGSFSLQSSNIAALFGRPCAMADKVLVEPDANAGMLTPVDPRAASDPLAGPTLTASDGGPTTYGFSANGIPKSLDSHASADSLGVLSSNVAASPDVLNNNASGTGGGESGTAGVNGSLAELPFGLNEATTPVLGSYSATDQSPARLQSSWYRLLPKESDEPLVVMSVAGRYDNDNLKLQYTTQPVSPTTRDADLTSAGEVTMIDPGPSPSWRNLRIYRSTLPKETTAVRITAVDNNLSEDNFMVVTPPRTPHLQTLQKMVGSSDPVQIDWTSGLAFPCQRPFDHQYGVAEVPKWRIMPGADLSAAVSAWQDSFGGGPLGWIEIALDSTTVPSYLQGDIGRDWGSLERYTAYDDPVTAKLDVGTARRSGLWSPAPIRY